MSSQPSSSVLSQTLHSITLTKIQELSKLVAAYAARKDIILTEADALAPRDRVIRLLHGVKAVCHDLDPKVHNIARFVEQSKYDSSFPPDLLDAYEKQLRSLLDVQSKEHAYAELHGKLLKEWLDAKLDHQDSQPDEDSNDFHLVERQKERLDELCDRFDKVCFTPLDTDPDAISRYLASFFHDVGKSGDLDLDELREQVRTAGEALLDTKAPFDKETLKWCIASILDEALLSDEKQKTLREFQANETLQAEIIDVLNYRWADLENWNWEAGPAGIPLLPRRDASSKYRIWMDEPVLEAILSQYIGVQWSVKLKQHLKRHVEQSSVWKEGAPSDQEKHFWARRELYLGPKPRPSLRQHLRSTWIEDYFCTAMPAKTDHAFSFRGGYDEDISDDGASDDGAWDWGRPAVKSQASTGSSVKQKLLHRLAASAFLERKLNGQVAVLQTDFQWFATGLSHATILAIMEFLGFPPAWITWFNKYLEAPLNLDEATPGRTPKGAQTRRRGVPMAHGTEKLIGEMILYFMDFVVYRRSGVYLLRLHDDVFVVGDPARVAEAWKAMQEFAAIMGLEFNMLKTGSVHLTDGGSISTTASQLPRGPVSVGFLDLNPVSGDWNINKDKVNAHVAQLKKQLAQSSSILSWVHTWNSCIGRFFGNNFGEPSHCFGGSHVDSILETYTSMHNEIFKDTGCGNLAGHVKGLLKERFGADVPEAFLYYPEDMGGLGIRNPFIKPLLLRASLSKSAEERWSDYESIMQNDWERRKDSWFDRREDSRITQAKTNFPKENAEKLANEFPSLEEHRRYEDKHSQALLDLYMKLASVPEIQCLELSKEVSQISAWDRSVTTETSWLAELYHGEVLRELGKIALAPRHFLPLAVLKMVKQRAVAWRMII